MWNPNGHLIQVELGNDVVKAATEPDTRNVIEIVFGSLSPKEGQILLDLTAQCREDLSQQGLYLPSINFIDNNQIKSNEVIVYFGLEVHRFAITHLEDIFQFIIQRIAFYYQCNWAKEEIHKLLNDAIIDIQHDQYQNAFEKYCIAYYHCTLNNYNYEKIMCLSDVGNILINNGLFQKALPLLLHANNLFEDQNIIDMKLKPSISINTGTVLYKLNNFDEANNWYHEAYHGANQIGQIPIAFLSLIYIAEVNYFLQNYDYAIEVYNSAIDTISLIDIKGERKSEIVININKEIRKINELKKLQSYIPNDISFFDKIKNFFLKTILPELVRAGFNYGVYKMTGKSVVIYGEVKNSIFAGRDVNIKEF